MVSGREETEMEQVWWHSSVGIISLVVLAVLGGGLLFLRLAFPDEKSMKAAKLARRIASCPQRIRQIQMWPKGGVVVFDLVADDEYMLRSQLVFKDKHPDFENLAVIYCCSVLEFRFQETPFPGLNPQDATAYLRLKP